MDEIGQINVRIQPKKKKNYRCKRLQEACSINLNIFYSSFGNFIVPMVPTQKKKIQVYSLFSIFFLNTCYVKLNAIEKKSVFDIMGNIIKKCGFKRILKGCQ